MPLHPKQFAVNECWIAFKATRTPVPIETGLANIFIVQDAASMYIFGNTFAPVEHESPDRGKAALLLRQCWEKKREWPKKLLLPQPISEDNGFVQAAHWNRIEVQCLPTDELDLYINDVQSSYEEFLSRDNPGDA